MRLTFLRRAFCVLGLIAVNAGASAPAAGPQRPKITGISHLSVYTTDAAATKKFYVEDVGCTESTDPENAAGKRYYVSPTQFIEVLPLPTGANIDRLDHVAYITSDADGLRRYMQAHGVAVPAKVAKDSAGEQSFRVKDPEGNVAEFIQYGSQPALTRVGNPIGKRIIHAGFLVHSREAEDKFYRDLLGFRPYWYGGMKDNTVDWVSQQVPDGTDWLEYMLTSGPSGTGIPATMSQRQLGVLNHLSIGVPDMQKAAAELKQESRLSERHDGPQIGRDGKWQFNLYDPDGTRVELMEFGAVRQPCCSPFTASNPSE